MAIIVSSGPRTPSPNTHQAQRQAWLTQAATLLAQACTLPCPLPDTPEATREFGFALLELSQANENDFARGWDALRNAVEKPNGCGAHQNAVVNFLVFAEKRRLQHLKHIAEHPHSTLTSVQAAHTVALRLINDLADANNLPLTKRVLAALAERRRAMGDPTLPADAVSQAPRANASNARAPAQATLSAIPIPGFRVTVKGGRDVAPQFTQGIKAKYTDETAGAKAKPNFSRLRAREGLSNVYTLGRTEDHGTSGKVRFAVDGNKHPWVIKEFRVENNPNGKKTLTNVSDPNDIIEEVALLDELKATHGAHDVFAVNEKVYVVLPLMNGDLQRIRPALYQENEYSTMMRAMFYDLAKTVAALHHKNIMHRDIKAENVLWNAHNQYQLVDFGQAHRGVCDAGDRKGTLGSLAPEILTRTPFVETYDKAVDIFSAGLLMAYCHADADLCPFWNAATPQAMAHAVQEYQDWRRARSFPDGTLNWTKIKRHHRPLDVFASQFHDGDADMAAYVFEHLLRVAPLERDQADAMLAKAKEMHDVQKPLHQAAAKAMERVAYRDLQRLGQLSQLGAYNDLANLVEAQYFAAHPTQSPLTPPPTPTPPHTASPMGAIAPASPGARSNGGAPPKAAWLSRRATA